MKKFLLSKMAMAIVACCAGIVLGWLLHSSQDGGGASLREASALSSVIASVPTKQSSMDRDGQRPTNESQMEGERLREPDGEDDEERMERRGIIMAQSAEEVRQAIIDNAGLDDAKIEQLDKAIVEMNRQMLEVSTKWADHIRETGTLDMDTRLRMQHDINGVSVVFSDRIDSEFPGWRGEGTDLTRLVRVTTAFEPFRKIRSEILRGEMGAKNTEGTESTEGDE